MALVRQLKTVGFRLISRYDIFVDRQTMCCEPLLGILLFLVQMLWPKSLTLWHPAAFGDFRKKLPKHTWLCAGISPVWYALQTRQKPQKMRQVF